MMGKTIEEAASEGGTLIEGSFSDIATVNPILIQDTPSADFLSEIFESLWEPNPDTLEPVGTLASAWETNGDATVWTAYLRDGINWQDGEPFTAADVKFTYELMMNDASGSAYASDLQSKIASVDVVDDMTVQFNLTDTLVDFPLDSGAYPIVAQHIWQDVDPAALASDGGSNGQDPSRVVGTGPFTFKEWATGDHATAERYDDYWGGQPHLDSYIYKVVADQAAGVAQLKTGEIDWMGGVSGSQVEDVKSTGDINVIDYPTINFTFYGVNLKKPPFDDVNVRKALLYALDRDALIESIRFGYGVVAVGTMPTLSWAYNPDAIDEKFEFDPDKAKQMLDDAGWTVGGDGTREKDGQQFAFSMYTNAGNQDREAYLTALQEFWDQIGVKMTPQLEPFPSLVDRIQNTKDFEAFLIGFTWSTTPDQSIMFSCDAATNGYNFAGYCNPEVDDLLQQARTEMDRQKRIDLYTEFQNKVLADLPIAILDFPRGISGLNKRVHNVFPNSVNQRFNPETWWIEQ